MKKIVLGAVTIATLVTSMSANEDSKDNQKFTFKEKVELCLLFSEKNESECIEQIKNSISKNQIQGKTDEENSSK